MPGLTTHDVQKDAQKTSSKNHALNIIIPIGGIGSRFSKVGYRYPKPLINIIGRPMILRIIDNLSLKPEDTLWMAVNAEIDDEFRIRQLVMKTFPSLDFRLLRLKHQTKGASETLYMTTQSMGAEYMGRRTADILQHVRDMPIQYGAVFYFSDDGINPIYSYIKTEGSVPLITDIREKKAISNKANTGAYVFATASLLHTWAAKNIDSNAQRPKGTQIGEYYTSQMIGTMIHDARLPFLGLPLSKKDFSCVGTPEQLEDLLMQMKDGQRPNQVKKRRFCFDLDMTLVGVPAVSGDYSTCPPIWKNIRLVQQLHKAGHHIIIQTARRMRTHQGNVGAILKDVGPVTFEQLERYEIPYHDIHFGKPWADVYVDDLAVNANLDTMKEIGWLLDEANPSSLLEPKGTVTRPTTPRPNQTTKAMIAARDFNTIQIVGDKVIKSSKSDAILGELFFYAHMPTNLLPVFPTGFAVDFLPETGNYTLEMEYRQGLTFSHLLVGRSITEGRLLTLLTALHSIHTTSSTLTPRLPISSALGEKFSQHSIERSGGVNIYANYGVKLRSRYYNNTARYAALGPNSAECFSRLNEFLDTYEAEDRGVHSVSFIDVRCQLENTLTMEGDIHYDLAKVLQSLVGYDHILFMDLGALPSSSPATTQPILDEADERILLRLQDMFWRFLEEKYAVTIHKKTLLRITASLLFSLIPLHKVELGPLFLRMCKSTLEMARGIPYKRAVGGGAGAVIAGVFAGTFAGKWRED
ncbi:capsule biosynthesis phosphatase [Leptodontidium sp. MPI-SDFR-AT-0119]|nr:capsule biosynthesis phosphatase [Leptodontidium sp. MPI-SDFR-AT-0119]